MSGLSLLQQCRQNPKQNKRALPVCIPVATFGIRKTQQCGLQREQTNERTCAPPRGRIPSSTNVLARFSLNTGKVPVHPKRCSSGASRRRNPWNLPLDLSRSTAANTSASVARCRNLAEHGSAVVAPVPGPTWMHRSGQLCHCNFCGPVHSKLVIAPYVPCMEETDTSQEWVHCCFKKDLERLPITPAVLYPLPRVLSASTRNEYSNFQA